MESPLLSMIEIMIKEVDFFFALVENYIQIFQFCTCIMVIKATLMIIYLNLCNMKGIFGVEYYDLTAKGPDHSGARFDSFGAFLGSR